VAGVEREVHVGVCWFGVDVRRQLAVHNTDADVQVGDVSSAIVGGELDAVVLSVEPGQELFEFVFSV
jgi:hypothetical protein